jgi:hypothetical protein
MELAFLLALCTLSVAAFLPSAVQTQKNCRTYACASLSGSPDMVVPYALYAEERAERAQLARDMLAITERLKNEQTSITERLKSEQAAAV